MWGCEQDLIAPLLLDGVEHKRCPNRPYFEDPYFFGEIFQEYAYYKRWGMPEEGTWKEQPNKLIEFFDVIESAKTDAQAYLEEKEREKASINKKLSSITQRP